MSIYKYVFVFVLGVSLLAGCFHSEEEHDATDSVFINVYGYKEFLGGGKAVQALYVQGRKVMGNDGFYLTGDDHLLSYNATEFIDSNTRVHFKSTGPGGDGQWFTNDDEFEHVSRLENASLDNERSIFFRSAGSDGIWNTSDDEIDNYSSVIKQIGENGILAFYSGPGEDGIWITEDDEISNYHVTSFSEETTGDSAKKVLFYVNKGIDGNWFTEDDVLENYEVTHYDSMENIIGHEWGFTAGQDDFINTEDDLTGFYSYREVLIAEDVATNSKSILRTLAGSDGVFNSDDDINQLTVSERVTIELSAFGHETSYNFETYYGFYENPGPDENWLTEDDVLSGEVANEVLEQQSTGFTSRWISWSSGSNGILGDSDDEIKNYSTNIVTIDETKLTDTTIGFSSPGADGVWLTSDDDVAYENIYINLWSSFPDK